MRRAFLVLQSILDRCQRNMSINYLVTNGDSTLWRQHSFVLVDSRVVGGKLTLVLVGWCLLDLVIASHISGAWAIAEPL